VEASRIADDIMDEEKGGAGSRCRRHLRVL